MHICRVTLGIAFILLISGTLANSQSRKNCGIAHHRQLSIGGILCFFHGLFAVAYLISATAEKKLHQHEQGHEKKPNPQELPAWIFEIHTHIHCLIFNSYQLFLFRDYSKNFQFVLLPICFTASLPKYKILIFPEKAMFCLGYQSGLRF